MLISQNTPGVHVFYVWIFCHTSNRDPLFLYLENIVVLLLAGVGKAQGECIPSLLPHVIISEP